MLRERYVDSTPYFFCCYFRYFEIYDVAKIYLHTNFVAFVYFSKFVLPSDSYISQLPYIFLLSDRKQLNPKHLPLIFCRCFPREIKRTILSEKKSCKQTNNNNKKVVFS